MKDKIEEIAEELRKRHSFIMLDRHVARILIKKGIIKKQSAAKCSLFHRDKPECMFACQIDSKDNSTGKDLVIIVKGDHHQQKRILRVLVQLGEEICTKREDEDKPTWKTKKVFLKEIRDVERDLVAFFEGKMKCEKPY